MTTAVSVIALIIALPFIAEIVKGMGESRVTWLFTYGSLMPGEPRWDAIAEYLHPDLGPVPAHVYGTKTDTRWGFPAAEFCRYDSCEDCDCLPIEGMLIPLNPQREVEALRVTDDIEGVAANLYRRKTVLANEVEDAKEAIAYEWTGVYQK